MAHINKTERQEIYLLKEKGYSLREIAKALARSPSTISREINRNSVKGVYDPQKAQHKKYARWVYRKRPYKKIVENDQFQKYLAWKLAERWSPEQIVGRWNKENEHAQITHKTVYTYLYSEYGIGLCKYLLSKRQRRKKRIPKQKRQLIPHRIWIDDRPDIINKRERIGDYEADLICSRKEDNTYLLVILDRHTRFIFCKKIYCRKPNMVIKKIQKLLDHFPLHSVTFDNGIEFAHHFVLSCPTYFCHPYSSWEKGQVEYANRLIRRSIPKKSFLKNYSQDFIDQVTYNLNNLPRKCLNWLTPTEALLKNISSVAFCSTM